MTSPTHPTDISPALDERDLEEHELPSPDASMPDDVAATFRALPAVGEGQASEEPAADGTSVEQLSTSDATPPEAAPVAQRPKRGRRKREGGVAPFVRPPNRFARYATLRGWRRRGFVPLSPARDKRRHRILPRTVIGISTMLMMLGIGAAFSGAAFYAYYDDRLATNEAEVARFVEGFDQQFDAAAGSLDRLRDESVEQIRAELLPLEQYTQDVNGVVTLPQVAGPSVWRLETLDDGGSAIVGSAFAVTGHNGGTALVTSLPLVQAATVAPAPELRLVKGDEVHVARLWTWDEETQVAVVVTDAVIPALELSTRDERTAAIGRSVFAMNGEGSQGAIASPGQLLDASAQGLQHTGAVTAPFEGGPVVTSAGEVIGLTVGAAGSSPIVDAVDADAFCVRVLRCAGEGDIVIADPDSEG